MTVISRRHRFVYLKSRKTAGTAVEAHLLTRTPLGGDIWHSAPNIREYDLPRRRRPVILGSAAGRLVAAPEIGPLVRYGWRWKIREHHAAAPLARLLGSFWDRALKVTNVRNPWDVMVSAWQWRREGRGQSPPVAADFDEWSRACLSGDVQWRKRIHAYDPRSLMDPFLFDDGRPLVDVLIRQEDIEQGLDEIGRRLGLSLGPIEIRENRSRRRRDYRSYYSDELAEAVGRYFSDVIALCGYAFDPRGPGHGADGARTSDGRPPTPAAPPPPPPAPGPPESHGPPPSPDR